MRYASISKIITYLNLTKSMMYLYRNNNKNVSTCEFFVIISKHQMTIIIFKKNSKCHLGMLVVLYFKC